jgi:hypothetical protein
VGLHPALLCLWRRQTATMLRGELVLDGAGRLTEVW